MKRLRRIMFNALTVISLLLFVATVVLWVRSYWAMDWYRYDVESSWDGQRGRRVAIFESNRGIVGADLRWTHILVCGVDLTSRPPEVPEPSKHVIGSKLSCDNNKILGTSNPAWHTLGFHFRSNGSQPREPERMASCPHGAIAVCFLLMPAFWLIRWLHSVRPWARPFYCACCGYDLRATPDRCPECGTSITTVADGIPFRGTGSVR